MYTLSSILLSLLLLLKCASFIGVTAQGIREASYRHRELGDQISEILDNIRKGYDKRVRPNYGGIPVEVAVTMYVLSISSLSEVEMAKFRLYTSASSLQVKLEPAKICTEMSQALYKVFCSFLKTKVFRRGPPVEVAVTMYVLSISSVSEVLMDFTVDFYFRQTWTDPRLKFTGPKGVDKLSVGSEFIKTMWVPDTFFVNEKKSYFHTATTSNEFLRIHDNGKVLRSIRLTVTASCPMDLQFFPMDRQLCNIEIESFGYTTRDILYRWANGRKSIGMDQVQLPQFIVLGHRHTQRHVVLSTVGYTMSDIRYKWEKGEKSVGVSNEVSLPQFKVLGYRQKDQEISLTTGNYSRLACEIQFVRSMGYYLIQIYIPSGLIVVISWVSFWLNRNATPARVALGVTTVLTMTTLMSSTNAALPKISYVKSIDVYLGTCFVMVFASLLEYATVGYMAKRIQMRKNRFLALQKMAEAKKAAMDHDEHHVKQTEVRFKVHDPKSYSKGVGTLENTVNGARGGDEENPSHPILPPGKDVNKLYGVTPSDIDKYSRVVFPVCFICFNLMYWIIYLHISDEVADDLVLL